MQLGFAHGSFETEQQAVVEVRGVIEAILIEDESVGQGADLQQPVPIRRTAGEPADLQSHHHADLTHTDRGDQFLKTATVAVGTGPSLVAVDDHHPIQRPAQRHRPLPQPILTLGALGVLEHLAQSALADVQVSTPGQMAWSHLAHRFQVHDMHSR